MQAEELLRAGQLSEALAALEAEVRTDPSNDKVRVFLFQLLSVMGDWERALNQLNVAAEIFAGKRSPLVFGEPDDWISWLIQANHMIASQKYQASQELRERAYGVAPAIPGSIDGQRFQWIADADSRLGPVLEAIVDGKYYWVPFAAVKQIQIDPPTDLRDMVWVPAHFT
ncbi:MAG: type VI secretion system accessory protein TagJ, partial [Planctomycetota bacterium]